MKSKVITTIGFIFFIFLNLNFDLKAKEENWLKTFDLPEWVGGRTSITSAVGLLPASLIGIDIKELLLGASIMDDLTRNTDCYTFLCWDTNCLY